MLQDDVAMRDGARPGLRAWRDPLEHALVGISLATLAVLTARSGGRETELVPPAVLLCLPALLWTCPWRRVRGWLLALFAALPASAIAVSFVSATQFAYARDLGVWAYASVLAVTTLGYARTPGRQLVLLLFFCVLGFFESVQAFVPWYASGSPTKAMVGTFYQQDMFGGFSAAVAVMALAVAVLGDRIWRVVGAVIAPACFVSTVLSTSRAAIALLLLGYLAVLLLVWGCRARWERAGAWLALVAAGVGMLFLITSSLLFPDRAGGSPLAGTTGRTGSDSLGSSSEIRQAYWRAATDQFLDNPLTGEGFGAFGLTFFERAPLGAFGSRYAHNGLLQGLGEGGVLFGVPLVMLSACALLLSMLVLVRFIRRRDENPWAPGLALLALSLFGHSLVDFDWSFPALAGALAVAAAGALSRERWQPSAVLPVAVTAVLVAAAVFSTYAVHNSAAPNALKQQVSIIESVERARSAERRLLPNPLLWTQVLLESPSDADVVDLALSRTERLAALDPNVQLLRARVLFDTGSRAAGLELAEQVVERTADSRPDLLAAYADMLVDAGEQEKAEQLLLAAVEVRSYRGFPLPDNVWRLVEALQQVAGADSRRAVCAFRRASTEFGIDSKPPSVVTARGVC